MAAHFVAPGETRPMFWVLAPTDSTPGRVVELSPGTVLTVNVQEETYGSLFGYPLRGFATADIHVRGGALAIHDNDMLARLVERVVRGGRAT